MFHTRVCVQSIYKPMVCIENVVIQTCFENVHATSGIVVLTPSFSEVNQKIRKWH